MYKTGGLEPNQAESKTLDIDGVRYVVSDKFRSMLRDLFIDWGTFLEIYHGDINNVTMFDQMVRLLNIKENEKLRESMIPTVKQIYESTAEEHMAHMLKQFMIYEPVSLAIHTLFTTIKLHYEYILERFLLERNKYITQHNLPDKLNNVEELKKYWSDMNSHHQLESSSVALLFLNPPKIPGVKSRLNFNITGLETHIQPLRVAVKNFHYAGFCPKVPHKRLNALLEFPVNLFTGAIIAMNPQAKFPDYEFIEGEIQKRMADMPKKPSIPNDIPRETPPDEILNDTIALARWYIDAILELRKKLLPYGSQYEDYYMEQAKIITQINDIVQREFIHRYPVEP